MRYRVALKNIYFILLIVFTVNNALAQAPIIDYPQPPIYLDNQTITPLTPTNTGGAIPNVPYGLVSTFAKVKFPLGLAVNSTNGDLYVVTDDFYIRKITPDGTLSVIGGNGNFAYVDGPALSASYWNGQHAVVDKNGALYFTENSRNTVRKLFNGFLSTFAGAEGAFGTGLSKSLNQPQGLVIDDAGNIIVADGSSRLITITPAGFGSVFSGNLPGYKDGNLSEASFNNPLGMARDLAGNIYVVDNLNYRIRKITPAGVVSTVAGSGKAFSYNGTGADAGFSNPIWIAVDAAGYLYVDDFKKHSVRRISPAGVVTTLAGDDNNPGYKNGMTTDAQFTVPTGLAVGNGYLYVSDLDNNLIRQIAISGYTIDKPLPNGLILDPATGVISGTPTVGSPATDYTITGFNGIGAGSKTITIQVVMPFTFGPIPNKTICDADFDPGATGGLYPIIYASDNTQVAVITAGKIHIIGTGTANISATSGDKTYTQPFTVVSQTDLTITPTYRNVDGRVLVQFTASLSNTVNVLSYQWQINGVNTGTNSPNFTSPDFNNSDLVTCTAIIDQGCAPISSNKIPVYLLVIPNVFTPNGDNINDQWDIAQISNYPNCEVSVYSRNGGLVYQSKGYPIPWNGRYNNSLLPVGVYYYVIDLGTGNKIAGSVTILR
jgi:gliding motility-associated-like protein